MCTTKSRQRQNKYSVVNSGQHQDSFSFDMEFCWAQSSLVYLYIMILRCTSRSYSKLGSPFKSMYSLSPPKSYFCYLLKNWGHRKCVFSLWLFCPSLNVFLSDAVFFTGNIWTDKATSYYYLTRKALRTLKIDKTENEKTFNMSISSNNQWIQTYKYLTATVPEGNNVAERGREKNSWLGQFGALV